MHILSRLIVVVSSCTALGLEGVVYNVTNTNDSGAGSFRQAILDNNSNSGPNNINFNIPGPGPHRIQPLTELDPITTTVTIDGYTQPGSSVNTAANGTNAILQIELNGNQYTTGDGINTGYGLQLLAGSDGSIIRGLVINDWFLTGINISESEGNYIIGNFIGTNTAGNVPMSNQSGVNTDSDNTVIGTSLLADRNLINGSFNIFQLGYAIGVIGGQNCIIANNIVGLDRSGNFPLGNTLIGIRAVLADNLQIGGVSEDDRNIIGGITMQAIRISGTQNANVQNNYIGVDVTGTRAIGEINNNIGVQLDPRNAPCIGNTITNNVISGNEYGVILGGLTYTYPEEGLVTSGNFFTANFIGTDATGTVAIGNKKEGIWVFEGGNTIGGLTPNLANVISGNGGNGILITSGTTETNVLGNFIGTDISGQNALGNGENGIQLGTQGGINNTTNNLIGTPLDDGGNIISGNRKNGILITSYSSGNVIWANFIGTNPAGNPIPNGGDGIKIVCSSGNQIGGLFQDEGNVIAYNRRGVVVGADKFDKASHSNSILSNSIYSNDWVGISLHKKNPSEPSDTNRGPNHFQTSPSIDYAYYQSNSTRISGALHSARNTRFRIQFFGSDFSSRDQGAIYLGETLVDTDCEGRVSFRAEVNFVSNLHYVTATATRLDEFLVAGDTSEFSAPKKVESRNYRKE